MGSSKRNLVSIFYDTLKPYIKKGKSPRATYSIKPSSLGTECLRKLYYSSFRVPEDFDVDQNIKKMGALGDGLSHVLSSKFRSQKILIDYKNPDGSFQLGMDGSPNLEFPISSKELKIDIGYIDAVLDIDGELWIGEYKSATESSFKKLTSPKPDHLIQAITYLFVFNKLLKEGKFSHIDRLSKFDKAKGLRFLYVDRNNAVDFPLKEFVISEDVAIEVFKKIALKVSNFSMYADSKQLPPKTLEWCQSCPWRSKCQKNYNIK